MVKTSAGTAPEAPGTLDEVLGLLPAAFAVTRGAEHRLVYANAAFRDLMALGEGVSGETLPALIAAAGREVGDVTGLLHGVFHTGMVARERPLAAAAGGGRTWLCSVWPARVPAGSERQLLVELRVATEAELSLSLPRHVAERMLLSALQQRDLAVVAESSRQRAEQACEAKTYFLGAMSNELRAPLVAIGRYVELLQSGTRGPLSPDQQADLERIRRNQQHLLAMIGDIDAGPSGL